MSEEVVKIVSINFSIECFSVHRFEQDQYDKVPMFIFGDFNFRLDINLLVQVRHLSQVEKGNAIKCCINHSQEKYFSRSYIRRSNRECLYT